ncbi:rod shape-determining protein MreD [Bacteroides sp. 214]|uniref:rod shape-determining protein MreD n=1 Tax=Bacteroides sp. 214 TaxID=2302935 RepID=UPI0013D0E282|nr:rod shape-determining protein MreD [Bacteroides sp. 214]NDW13841.1 rod shape-determining protein MreD [Bacteroides sp. 214]
MRNTIQNIVWFVALVLIQVVFLNRINFFGYATPLLYILYIIKQDSSISHNKLLLLGFLLGLLIDLFSNTPGINAASTVVLAFVRPFFLRLFTPRDNQDTLMPSVRSLGRLSYVKFLFASILTHHLVTFSIMFFSFADITTILLKTMASGVLTFVCIVILDKVSE